MASDRSEDILSCWLHKADPTGKRWKKRYVVANKKLQTLSWFKDNPLFSMTKYQVKEEPLGQISLSGATTRDCAGEKDVKGPTPLITCISAPGRNQLLSFETLAQQCEWKTFLESCISSGVQATGSGTDEVITAGLVEPFAGPLLKAAPGWRIFQQRFVFLDADELCMRYFDVGPSGAHLQTIFGGAPSLAADKDAWMRVAPMAGPRANEASADIKSSKGVIQLRGASLSLKPWGDDAGGLLATSPTFSVCTQSGRLYAFIARSYDEMGQWTSRIQAVVNEADELFVSGVNKKVSADDSIDTMASAARVRAKKLSMIAPILGKLRSAASPTEKYANVVEDKEARVAGYLYKIGKTNKWTLRYFVLRGGALAYYTDHTLREMKGSLLLTSASTSLALFPSTFTGKTPTENKFTCSGIDSKKAGQDMRTLLLCSEKPDDWVRWRHEMATVINAHRAIAGVEMIVVPDAPPAAEAE